MKRHDVEVLGAIVLALALSCAAALHVIRSIVDIADDLCVATMSDKNLDPDLAALLAGRTPQEACRDTAIARLFADKVLAAQREAKAQLRKPVQVGP